MVTATRLLSWRPGALDEVTTVMLRHRRVLVELEDELASGAPPSSWSSEAAEMARTRHAALRRAVAGVVAEVSQAAAALDIAHEAVRSAQDDLEHAISMAGAHGFALDQATGRVTDGVCLADPHQAADREALRAEVTDRVEQALRHAAHADTALAAALRGAAGGLDGGSSSFAEAAALGSEGGQRGLLAPPPGGSDHDQNAWWEGLTRAEQDRIVAEHPEWIGGTDGIPGWARDAANRNLLAVHRATLEAEYARYERLALGPPVNSSYLDRLATIEDKLDGIDAVEETLARGGRQLLLLDITGGDQLRAAIAHGDVDTADHVAVFTPGFTTTVAGSMTAYDARMSELAVQAAAEADKYGSGGTVATVAWLGYEAPQWDTTLDPGASVIGRGAAEAGADDLAAFYNGIDAARDADPHLTALGHSYGSLTTGLALQQQTGVDDVVFFGSPGIGTNHVTDLDVPQGHAYLIEARWDPVADAGGLAPFGIDPTHMDGVTGLSAKDAVVGADAYAGSSGHSAYLDEGSTSLHNMAAVVGGAPDRLVEDSGRGLGDILSWPLPWTY